MGFYEARKKEAAKPGAKGAKSKDGKPAPAPKGLGDAPAPSVGGVDVRDATGPELDQIAAQNTPEQGGAPSVAIAAASVTTAPVEKGPRGVIGKGQTIATSPQAAEKATQSFLDHYRKVGVPKLVRHFVQTGQFEKAQTFQTWADSAEVKAQMASWSKAIWAIKNGDEDGFIANLGATYNAIDDGMSIVPSKPGSPATRAGTSPAASWPCATRKPAR